MKRLREEYGDVFRYEKEFIAYYVKKHYGDPFSVLVAVILSQNTTEKNAFDAWFSLEKGLGKVTPENVLKAGVEKIEKLIRKAGLQKQKAKAIYEAAKRWEELKEAIARGDPKPLLSIKGIGRKTVDVVMMSFGHRAFPVDTHVKRVAMRLGWASGSYEKVSEKLKEMFRGREMEAHMLLILHGRRICKAKKPECWRCPLRDICPYAGGLGTTTALTGPSGPGK